MKYNVNPDNITVKIIYDNECPIKNEHKNSGHPKNGQILNRVMTF